MAAFVWVTAHLLAMVPREPSKWTTGWDMSRPLGWAAGLFLLFLQAWLPDATVPMATSTSWSGTVNGGWITCQLSPHLTQTLWTHSRLEKRAAMDLQMEDKTMILV